MSGSLQASQMTQDVIANRPAAAAYIGFWYAMDQGAMYYSNGVTWLQLGTNDVPVFLRSGMYSFTTSSTSSSTGSSLGNNTFRSALFAVPRPVTIIRIGSEITGVGDAGSVMRLGIYADDGTGLPGALVLDAGTIPSDASGVAEIVCNVTLPAGAYWAGAGVQGAPVTQPGWRSYNAIPAPTGKTTIPIAGSVHAGWDMAGVAGALPNPASAVVPAASNGPRVFVKVA